MSTETPTRAGASTTSPSVAVTPTKNLRSGQYVTVTVRGEPNHATLLVLECSFQHTSYGEDDCENRQNAVVFGNASQPSSVVTKLQVQSVIDTAVGRLACGSGGCLVAVVRLNDNSTDTIVGFQGLSFAKGAKPLPNGHGPPAPPTWQNPPNLPAGRIVAPGRPARLQLVADPAGDLATGSAISGPSVCHAPGGDSSNQARIGSCAVATCVGCTGHILGISKPHRSGRDGCGGFCTQPTDRLLRRCARLHLRSSLRRHQDRPSERHHLARPEAFDSRLAKTDAPGHRREALGSDEV
ncbi:MAG: neocarzinostatin apoprotein domain-containing protein [Acidimicrobiales bacterium]